MYYFGKRVVSADGGDPLLMAVENDAVAADACPRLTVMVFLLDKHGSSREKNKLMLTKNF